MAGLFRRTCLKPSYSLRRQLLLSFGLAGLLTLATVVAVACIFGYFAGQTIKEHADDLLREQVAQRLVRNSRYVSDSIATYFYNIQGSIQLTTDFVQDRIVGYPLDGWETDQYVPFKDRETGTNKYPLKAKPLALDWEFVPNIDAANAEEHLPDRTQEVLQKSYAAGAASESFYFFQGTCDPSDTNTSSPRYYKNCTDANNDPATGGVLRPTPTNKGLYEKSADIGALLKPIFEAEKEVAAAGVFFVNSGASSIVQYPSGVVGDLVSSYNSSGCEWLRELNFRSGRPYGSEDEIARCRPAGETMLPREYSPLERRWYQIMAASSGISWLGPLTSKTPNALPIYLVGQGIYDRK